MAVPAVRKVSGQLVIIELFRLRLVSTTFSSTAVICLARWPLSSRFKSFLNCDDRSIVRIEVGHHRAKGLELLAAAGAKLADCCQRSLSWPVKLERQRLFFGDPKSSSVGTRSTCPAR